MVNALASKLKSRLLTSSEFAAIRKALNVSPAICTNVKAWTETQPSNIAELICESLVEPRLIQRKPPSTIELQIHPAFSSKPKYTPEKYLARIHNAQMLGQHGIIVLPNGHYTSELIMGNQHLVRLPEYYDPLKRAFLKKRRKSGCYYSLLLLHATGANYYHWMHDVLGRLYLILEHLPQDITFIVPENLKPWQYQSLEAVGINRSQLIAFSGDELWQLETLYFSPPSARSGFDLSSGHLEKLD